MIAKILLTTAAMAGISGILAILLVIAERFLADYGEVKITINDEKELTVTGGSSLLASLSREKIFLPSACGGRGTCAYCKCKILDGVGPVLPTEEPLLTKEEIQEKVRLACQVKVKQDMRIEIPDELFNIKEFQTQVALIKDLTYDIKLIRLKLVEPDSIRFVSGQYVQIYNEPYDDVKESVSRAYSIASSNAETEYIDLMIRLVPEGIMTTWVFNYLKEGDSLKVVGPMGDFRLHEGDGEIILIAGGSGMAPIVSLLKEIEREKIDREVIYFFGANTRADLFFVDEMKAFEKSIPSFRFIPTLSNPETKDRWDGETGLITMPLEKYLKQLTDTSKTQAYLCGSPGMVNACVAVLEKYKISSDRIFFDPFA